MAYAAVTSLKHAMDRLTNLTNNPLIRKSTYEKLNSLHSTLRRVDGNSNGSIVRSAIYALDVKIRETVCKLQDAVESYLLWRSLPPSDGWPAVDENGAEQEMDLFLQSVKKLEEEYVREVDKPLADEEDGYVLALQVRSGGKKSNMAVGVSDQSTILIKLLVKMDCSYVIGITLLGMAGIGKTRLAREIYEHPQSLQHFVKRAWLSIGPTYQPKNILVDLVAQIDDKPRNLYMGEDMDALVAHLANCLDHVKYLIVLDDLWHAEILKNLLHKWLPKSRSQWGRILVTTRVIKSTSESYVVRMNFLNNDESWNLLWENVFDEEERFPPQLEKLGRKIAEHCEGLPLYILAVADVLRGHDKTMEYWKKVAQKKTTTFKDAYNNISKIVYSSYEYLPQYLKACFLYMGVFPQGNKISLSKLINLWIVEDFLESNGHDSLEHIGMICMRDLVSHSLAIVCKQVTNYKIRSSKLHCVYWYLCVEEAGRSKLFRVLKTLTDCSQDCNESQRRLSVQNNILFGIKEVYNSMAKATLATRSLLFTGEDHHFPVRICFNMMLLKVLDALAIRFYEFPIEVLNLLQLRYLALTHNGNLPSSISKLQQLQCLIVRRHHNIRLVRESTCSLPKEIWIMQELRYLRILGCNLSNPSYGACLPNLLTLYVNAESCTEDVFRCIPNLRKLRIQIELQPDAAETLSCLEHVRLLDRLESLKCVILNPQLRSRVLAPPNHLSKLPWALEKLSLHGLGYSCEYMSAIGLLSHLEVLKLRCSAFQGPNWKVNHKEFPSVEYLLLEDIDLVQWTTDDGVCFPSLRHLIIQHCYKLKEIPSQIGAINTLEKIEIVDCSPSVVASALQIQQKRIYPLEVAILSSWKLRR